MIIVGVDFHTKFQQGGLFYCLRASTRATSAPDSSVGPLLGRRRLRRSVRSPQVFRPHVRYGTVVLLRQAEIKCQESFQAHRQQARAALRERSENLN